MTPDIEVLCREAIGAAIAVPAVTTILAVETAEQVEALADSASVTYKPRNFIPIPPFLVPEVHKSIVKSNGDATSVLIDCVKAIKKFDTDHSGDQGQADKAKSKCKDLLFWLFLVAKNHVLIDKVPWMNCS
eukprot:7253597-Ditylum_brightwellii.AAC.1